MSEDDGPAAVELLARRADLLEALREGPHTKRELVTALDVSRSTVDRAVRNLEAAEYVVRDDGHVRLTLKGRLALDAFETLLEGVESIEDAALVLEPLPSDTTLDVDLLRDSTVVDPRRHTPERPVHAVLEIIEDATAVRGFASAVLPSHVPVYRDRVVDHGATVDLVVTEPVLDELVANHREPVVETVSTGRLSLWRATDTLEYSLLVVEQRERTLVCAIVYDDRGVAGIVKNDSAAAIRWARGVCADIQAAAEPVHLADG